MVAVGIMLDSEERAFTPFHFQSAKKVMASQHREYDGVLKGESLQLYKTRGISSPYKFYCTHWKCYGGSTR